MVAPRVAGFAPTWLLISAGFDAHRRDPLTDLGLAAGDFADLTVPLAQPGARAGRRLLFLEGGYDLDGPRDVRRGVAVGARRRRRLPPGVAQRRAGPGGRCAATPQLVQAALT